MTGITPIEREINKLKRQRDELEWEGQPFEHLERQINSLIEQMMQGEKYYVNF